MERIPERFHDLFDRRTFAHFATVMPDGTPQVTPVWVDYDVDENELLINTARGRTKERNVAANPKVGVSLLDPEDPYRYLSVRGRVVALREEGAREHIDELARHYLDADKYPYHDRDEGARVIVAIRPDRVIASET